jgi:CheY-like chemotaxis protein
MSFRALIVDDEPSVLTTLKAVFESRSFSVSTAASAGDAKQVLAQLPFDLVLTDMRMETATAGYEVVRSARALAQKPVIVILTAFPLPSNEWREAGADAMFVKGGGIFRILDDIEQLLRRHGPIRSNSN